MKEPFIRTYPLLYKNIKGKAFNYEMEITVQDLSIN